MGRDGGKLRSSQTGSLKILRIFRVKKEEFDDLFLALCKRSQSH